MVAIFESISPSNLDRIERFQRLRGENRERGETTTSRTGRFDGLAPGDRSRTVRTPDRVTEYHRREERERRDWNAPHADDGRQEYDDESQGGLLTFLSTSAELDLRRAFGPGSQGGQEQGDGDTGLAGRDGAAIEGARGVTGTQASPSVGPAEASAALNDSTTEAATFSGTATGPKDATYKFYYGRPTGYGAGRSMGGAQPHYTPYGRSAGYPDFVERSSHTVHGGTAVVRLSEIGLDLSAGTPPEAYGLA